MQDPDLIQMALSAYILSYPHPGDLGLICVQLWFQPPFPEREKKAGEISLSGLECDNM